MAQQLQEILAKTHVQHQKLKGDEVLTRSELQEIKTEHADTKAIYISTQHTQNVHTHQHTKVIAFVFTRPTSKMSGQHTQRLRRCLEMRPNGVAS